MLKVRHGRVVGPPKMMVNEESQSQVERSPVNDSPMKLSGDAELIDHQHRMEEDLYEHHSTEP